MPRITNMATVRNFGIIFNKFKVVETCTSGNYARNVPLNWTIIYHISC